MRLPPFPSIKKGLSFGEVNPLLGHSIYHSSNQYLTYLFSQVFNHTIIVHLKKKIIYAWCFLLSVLASFTFFNALVSLGLSFAWGKHQVQRRGVHTRGLLARERGGKVNQKKLDNADPPSSPNLVWLERVSETVSSMFKKKSKKKKAHNWNRNSNKLHDLFDKV